MLLMPTPSSSPSLELLPLLLELLELLPLLLELLPLLLLGGGLRPLWMQCNGSSWRQHHNSNPHTSHRGN